MSRQIVDLGQENVELRPQAAPVQTFVQAPANPNAGKDLFELAQSLQGFSSNLDQYVGVAAEQQKQQDALAGQEAYYKNNAQGYSDAVASGSIPAQSSPMFMRSYQQAQGDALGQSLALKWQNSYDTWDGKNATGPDAQANFENFRRQFFQDNLPANMDPYTFKGLQPHLAAITQASNNVYMQDQHQLVYKGNLTTAGTVVNQQIDQQVTQGVGNGTAPDYNSTFATMQSKINDLVKQGVTRIDAVNAMNEVAANKAIQYKDPSYLQWFNQKDPTTGATYGENPAGTVLYDTTRKQVDRLQRSDLADQAREAEQQQKAEKQAVTGAIQDQLAANPRAPIDPALMQRAKLAGVEPVSVQSWRDTLSKGMPSDTNGMMSLYGDMLHDPQNAQDILNHAQANGLFTQPQDLKDARTFAVELGKDPDGTAKILNDPQVQQVSQSITDRLAPKDELGEPLKGVSDQGFAAQNSFQRAVVEWQLQNPNATTLQKMDAIGKIGASVLSSITVPSMSKGPGAAGQYMPPANAPPNPYGNIEHAQTMAQQAAAAQQQQKVQDGAIQQLESQKPGWWSRLTDPSGSAAAAARIDAQEALVRAQPSAPPQNPSPTSAQPPDPGAFGAWRAGLTPAYQQRVDAAVQQRVQAGMTPEAAQADLYNRVHPPAQATAPPAQAPAAAPAAAASPAVPTAKPRAATTPLPTSPVDLQKFQEWQSNLSPTTAGHFKDVVAAWAKANGTTPEAEAPNVYAEVQRQQALRAQQQSAPPQQPAGIHKSSFDPATSTPGQVMDAVLKDPHGALDAMGVQRTPEQDTAIKTAQQAISSGIDAGYAKALHPTGDYTPMATNAVDKNTGSILDFISSHESGGNYNAVVGNAKSDTKLSNYTLNDIYKIQDQLKAAGKESTAIGRYQFIKSTLQTTAHQLGLSGNEQFTPQLQDRLATRLMQSVGYDDWKAGKISDGQFGNNLATQWASLPKLEGPGAGKGVYDGVGSNRALTSAANFAGTLAGAKSGAISVSPDGSLLRADDGMERDGPYGPGDIYRNIPAKNSRGEDQIAQFKAWNPDPVGNDQQNLDGLNKDLADVVKKARLDNPDLPFVIGTGKRSPEEQAQAIKWGWSKKVDSDHLNGDAVDLWPLDASGHVQFDPALQQRVAKAMDTAASGLGISLDVGAKHSKPDLPHFGLRGRTA